LELQSFAGVKRTPFGKVYFGFIVPVFLNTQRRKVAQNTNALFLTDRPTAQLYQHPKIINTNSHSIRLTDPTRQISAYC
jgi:hypothetical protein